MASSKRRHQLLTDRKLQGALLVHTSIYWFYCLFSVTLIAVCWIIFTKEPETSSELFTQLWLNCGPALLGSVLLLPLVLMDCLRLSSRFAGPMVRIQRVMRELAAGETPPNFELRPGDYWIEFAEDVNTVMDRLRKQDAQSAAETWASVSPVEEPTATLAPEIKAPATSDPTPELAPLTTNSPTPTQSIYSDLSL